MGLTLLQIDKSGSSILEKDYSIVLVKDKKKVYGVNIPQKVKDSLMHSFNSGELRIEAKSHKASKLRFKIRFHTSVVIELIKASLKGSKEVSIQICNDYDGHFHEIKNMIYDHIIKLCPRLQKEDILQTKFPKPSSIDTAGKNIRNGIYKDYNIVKLDADYIKKSDKEMTATRAQRARFSLVPSKR